MSLNCMVIQDSHLANMKRYPFYDAFRTWAVLKLECFVGLHYMSEHLQYENSEISCI
jgi:hypothetical protein